MYNFCNRLSDTVSAQPLNWSLAPVLVRGGGGRNSLHRYKRLINLFYSTEENSFSEARATPALNTFGGL
jgi:hypothetical protein